MKRPPFKIEASTFGAYKRDGKHVVSGRTSFCWETLVTAIASGLDGVHEIRRDAIGRKPATSWYRIEMTIEEAEQALNPRGDFFGRRRVAHARRFRQRQETTR